MALVTVLFRNGRIVETAGTVSRNTAQQKGIVVILPAEILVLINILRDVHFVATAAKLGGMVGLSTRGKKVTISINVGAYESSDLTVSSQLLELAELVNDNRTAQR